MVERQFRASIKMTGDIWYTAWVDAGQPDLKSLIHYKPSEEEFEGKGGRGKDMEGTKGPGTLS